ncbi:uncharacterized protein LOC112556240 isoform X2 [Pomacea canaliculata]|nr:uncharacterized protein LOC112556240 isoform X2 [Pomacea canaliculata]
MTTSVEVNIAVTDFKRKDLKPSGLPITMTKQTRLYLAVVCLLLFITLEARHIHHHHHRLAQSCVKTGYPCDVSPCCFQDDVCAVAHDVKTKAKRVCKRRSMKITPR